jgi:hypothetical protein
MLLQVRTDETELVRKAKEEINRRYIDTFHKLTIDDLNVKSVLKKLHQGEKYTANCIFAAETFHNFGLVDPKRFGAVTARHFWYFIYIIDRPEYMNLRKRYLLALQKVLKNHPAMNQYYARLYDKLAILEGRKQRYGTQVVPNYEHSIIDFQDLKSRREAMNLR